MIEFRDSLLQEELIIEDPTGWRMLVGCILLNRTSRRAVECVRADLFKAIRDPGWGLVLNISREEHGPLYAHVHEILMPLGLITSRIRAIGRMSQWWLQTEPELRSDAILRSEPPGVGPYAAQSWEIFVLKREPTSVVIDEELLLYLETDRWHGRSRR